MTRDVVKIVLLFILIAALQITIVPFISVNSIEPQLLVIFTVYFAIKLKKTHALWFGFFVGILFDLVTNGILGVSAFGMTLIAFIAVENSPKFNALEILSYKFLGLIFITAAVYSFITNFLIGFTVNFLYAILLYGILAGLYTALFASPLLFLTSENRIDE